MPDTPARRAIHAFVSNDAHDRWHDFAAEEGVSVSALIEAFALELGDAESGKRPMSERLGVVVVSARKIDALRRRRRKS